MIAYMVNLCDFEPGDGTTIIPLHVHTVERDRVYFADPEQGLAFMPKCSANHIIFVDRAEAKAWIERSVAIRRGLLEASLARLEKIEKHLEEL